MPDGPCGVAGVSDALVLAAVSAAALAFRGLDALGWRMVYLVVILVCAADGGQSRGLGSAENNGARTVVGRALRSRADCSDHS